MMELPVQHHVQSDKPSIFDLTRESLADWLVALKQPAYRATQLLEWIYQHGARTHNEMTNISKPLREILTKELPIFRSQVITEQQSQDGTIKLLLRWPDGATSECVFIPDGERRTACISTQVGCPVGCVFCASGLNGLQRQLNAGEIVEQAMRIRACCDNQSRLSNVVFMGLGEPLANYEASLQALRTINADWGLNIGARKITISTVGLPSQIKRLADERIQITLALSLHAPTDDLRQQIIPWADRVGIEPLIEACNYFFERTGREITLEYILLGGLNDHTEHAESLARIARRMRVHVNLLQYNPVPDLPYHRPGDKDSERFLTRLRDLGINAHLRRSRGRDIDAACGQLRRRQGESDTCP